MATPEGIFSILDTDLYKLTMQCAILKFYPKTNVTYHLTNRTADKRLNQQAYAWLKKQLGALKNITLTPEEFTYLEKICPYLNQGEYLQYLQEFRFRPDEHISIQFESLPESEEGNLVVDVKGLWIDTILYEIPILALVSEAYFLFCDTDWNHDDQESNAYDKSKALLEGKCAFSEFGSRRRRDYKTQEMVIKGLKRASEEFGEKFEGKLTGTSNVHFAMQHDIPPIGTVAHEWFMGIAAESQDYAGTNKVGLTNWVDCFGRGVLAIALTDTFGTPAFLRAFAETIPSRLQDSSKKSKGEEETFADIFTGTRQDSGDPMEFLKMMRQFYDVQNIKDKKMIVYSDSLNVDKCIHYQNETAKAGLASSFGIGTFFTNDFTTISTGQKSTPLNIVIKLSSVNGHPAIKLSDDTDKNMGDEATVKRVKEEVHYSNKHWVGADEKKRW